MHLLQELNSLKEIWNKISMMLKTNDESYYMYELYFCEHFDLIQHFVNLFGIVSGVNLVLEGYMTEWKKEVLGRKRATDFVYD